MTDVISDLRSSSNTNELNLYIEDQIQTELLNPRISDDPVVTAIITAEDTNGNPAKDDDKRDYDIKLEGPEVTITINVIAGDDVINEEESKDIITLTGEYTISEDVDPSTVEIIVTVDGVEYTTDNGLVVDEENKTWELDVPGEILVDSDDPVVTAIITAEDTNGNPAKDDDKRGYKLTPILIVGNNEDDSLTGHGGDDVIVGDKGGYDTIVTEGKNYNIVFLLDTSGSMTQNSGTNGLSRMAMVKQALRSFINDIKDHDGQINFTIIGFDATIGINFTLDDLNEDNVDKLLNQIPNLKAGGTTSYTIGFDATNEALSKQAEKGYDSENYENVVYFLSDGKPNVAQKQHNKAFKEMASAHNAKVHAIGIGTEIKTVNLESFDNTGDNTIDIELISSFRKNIEGWSIANGEGSLSRNTDIGRLVINSLGSSNEVTVVHSPEFSIEEGKYAKVAFGLEKLNANLEDVFIWKVEKYNEDTNEWNVVAEGENPTEQRVLTDYFEGAGKYRLVFEIEDNSNTKQYKVEINNVELYTTDDLSNWNIEGKVDIINTAKELKAVLESGGIEYKKGILGMDIIEGKNGDEIIFGDALNTDYLDWEGRTNIEHENYMAKGSGIYALEKYLSITDPSYDDMTYSEQSVAKLNYIKEHYEKLGLSEEGSGGNDYIDGGAGRDIIYAQGGNDTIISDINTNSGKAAGDIIIDGGAGFDTLILEEDNNIDFSILKQDANVSISNIEAINMKNGDHKLTNLTIEDVLNMTDGNNILKILGDSLDKITLKDMDESKWIMKESGVMDDKYEGSKFDVYEGIVGDETVTLKIEQEIEVIL